MGYLEVTGNRGMIAETEFGALLSKIDDSNIRQTFEYMSGVVDVLSDRIKEIQDERLELLANIASVEESIEEIEKKLLARGEDIREIKEEYPLLPPEAEDLSNAVKRKMTSCCGGYDSPAYKNNKGLRRRICIDIYEVIKREYGLVKENGAKMSYKKLKRKYFKPALRTVDVYTLPAFLEELVTAENDVGFLDEDE